MYKDNSISKTQANLILQREDEIIIEIRDTKKELKDDIDSIKTQNEVINIRLDNLQHSNKELIHRMSNLEKKLDKVLDLMATAINQAKK